MTRTRRVLLPALIVVVVAIVATLLAIALRSHGGDSGSREDTTSAERDPDLPAPTQADRNPDETPREAGTLVGRVRRRDDGAPAGGARVVLSGGGMDRVATTARDGSFSFEHVDRSGHFDLSVQVDGFGPLVRRGLRLGRHRRLDLRTLWLTAGARIRVVVRDVGGSEISGATVEAYLAGDGASPFEAGVLPTPVAGRRTSSHGIAAFDDLSSDTWVFVARAAGRERRSTGPVTVHGSTSVQKFLITLGPAAQLAGVVRARGGGPLDGVEVVAMRRTLAADHRTAPLAVRTVTGADGSFTLRGLPVGDVVIWTARDGEPLTVAAAVSVPEVAQLDITLAPSARLVGRLVQVESGEPLGDAIVHARFVLPLGIPTTVSGAANAQGEFDLRLPGAGRVDEIDVVAPGMHPVKGWGPNLDIVTVQSHVYEVLIEMAAGVRLTGVVKGGGAPLAGATVVVEHPVETREATTDFEGRYVFESLRAGAVTVRARRWGHGPAAVGVTVPADRGGGTLRQDFDLERGVSAKGVVLDAKGDPAAGADVFVTDQPRAVGTETNAHGHFETGPLTPGEQWVEVHHTGHSPSYAKVQAGVTALLRLRPLVRVRGRVTDRGGNAVPGAIVRAAGSDGASGGADPMQLDWAWLAMDRSSVSADGTFDHSVAIIESAYLVRAEAPGYAPVTVQGTDAELHLMLDRGVALEGVVEDGRGNPVAGAWVGVTRIADAADPEKVRYPGAWGPPVRAVTDAQGRFEIPGLLRERYLVMARVDGAWTARAAADAPSSRVRLAPR